MKLSSYVVTEIKLARIAGQSLYLAYNISQYETSKANRDQSQAGGCQRGLVCLECSNGLPRNSSLSHVPCQLRNDS